MPLASPALDFDVLAIDGAAETDRIARRIAHIVGEQRRRGAVVSLSGGVDSSVCAALAVQALGAAKVFGLLLPEHESSAASARLGRLVAERLGIAWHEEPIGPCLEAIGCYRRRDEAIRTLVPRYDARWRSKIVIVRGAGGGYSFFKLVAQSPDGEIVETRLPHTQYLQIVAATSFKQRIRKTIEYFHADRLHYAAIGTPNRLEYDQGFFVKNGDGAADLKPIAHLYKTQVYALARHLALPSEVCAARPSTDTYTLEQGQDEFYFGLPYEQMDLALWAHNHGIPAADLAVRLEVSAAEATAIYASIEAKRRTTRHLHARPALVEPVTEILA
jgi:NAD+ synthase